MLSAAPGYQSIRSTLNFEALDGLSNEERLSAERNVNVPAHARKWASTLDGDRKEDLRAGLVKFLMQFEKDETES